MKIAICTSPLKDKSRIRGIGFYTKRLIRALQEVDRKNQYIFFTQGQKLPKIDLIHYPYFDLFNLTLPLVKRVKTVLTIHDLTPLVFPDKFPKGVKGGIKFQIQKQSLRGVEAIITDSKNSKKDIVKFIGFPKEKIFVVPLAPGKEFKKLEIGNWKLEIKQKYQLPNTFVLYVGDVNYNKNIPGLVRACEKIKVPLVIVGKQAVEKNINRLHPENKDLVWLQDHCQSPITNHQSPITLLGFVPNGDLVAIYNLATVYCQPSFYEGFGLPVLEAMACGTPVVCADTSSLPEIGGKAAVYVDPYDINDIARGISEVLHYNDTYHCKKVEEGLRQAKKFSWKKTARKTIKVYERVMVNG